MRVQRKNGTLFDARLYVSPLIDAHGQQTGWMTSMTDITEPNRVRQQLTAAHERFTIVLESLDASVSVAPLGSEELLFANKLYRQWFGSQTAGHLQLVAQAGVLPVASNSGVDDEDGLMGLPTDPLTSARSENAEIYLPDLGKWLEVRSRYLNWVDGRLAQMVIATDITPAAWLRSKPSARRSAPNRSAASSPWVKWPPAWRMNSTNRSPPSTITVRAWSRASKVGRSRKKRCCRHCKNRPPGAACGPNHPAHPRLCEKERTQPHVGRRAQHGV